MAGSSIGNVFKLTTFGESHGIAIGGVIDGVPAGMNIDLDEIQSQLDRRRPGQSKITTQRTESDFVEILSGVFEGKSTGTPIGFIIRNNDHRSGDYEHLRNTFRPSHSDFTYDKKYSIRDHRGGGRSSARETACRVVAGAIAKQILATKGIEILAYVSQVGHVRVGEVIDYTEIDNNEVRCPDAKVADAMRTLIENVKSEGDTIGGCITCEIYNVPAGLGEPVFDKLHAALGSAMLSINAVKGFEYGSGFGAIEMRGSEHNDIFEKEGTTLTNFSGGIQGGISNGMPIKFRVAFKPVATIIQTQKSITKEGDEVDLEGKGRHDPCVVPRAVPIVESMAAIVLLDMFLRNQSVHLK